MEALEVQLVVGVEALEVRLVVGVEVEVGVCDSNMIARDMSVSRV